MSQCSCQYTPSTKIRQASESIYLIGRMCLWKCEIFKGLGNVQKCEEWSPLPIPIFNGILRKISEPIFWKDVENRDEYIRRIIHASLIHCMYTTSEKLNQTYHMLFMSLCGNRKNPPFYIEGARKRFFPDISEIISFIEFFIDH